MSVLILKADGTAEAFSREKLEASLRKAGASQNDRATIIGEIESGLEPGATTASIYRDAFARLKVLETGVAARYSLRRAVHEFGPSGFPFESYLAAVFRTEGFEAATNHIAHGACVEHEIDVLLSKDGKKIYVEAKFHNAPGFKTDLKVVLYVAARIEDIRKREGESASGMVVTNTKFTSMAQRYATCAGLPILSWEYPSENSLHDRIEKAGLYPITALSSLSKKEKLTLLTEKIVLCQELLRHGEALRGLGLPRARIAKVAEEAAALCRPQAAV